MPCLQWPGISPAPVTGCPSLAQASGQPSTPLLLLIKGKQHELVGLKCSTYKLPEKAPRHTSDISIDFFIGRVWHGARAMIPGKRGNMVGNILE